MRLTAANRTLSKRVLDSLSHVPRSVIVLSGDHELFEHLRAALARDRRFFDAGESLHCDGMAAPLSNIYPVRNDPVDWEHWTTAVSDMPDPRTMSALIFECRSPEWIAEVGQLMALSTTAPVWFVDVADTAWPADQVDPRRLTLA